MTMFALKDIKPNPFRNIDRYPIRKETIAELRQKFRSTSFWPVLIARSDGDGGAEIAFGHHRLIAAREEYGQKHEVNLIIQKLDDASMLRMMADENMEDGLTDSPRGDLGGLPRGLHGRLRRDRRELFLVLAVGLQAVRTILAPLLEALTLGALSISDHLALLLERELVLVPELVREQRIDLELDHHARERSARLEHLERSSRELASQRRAHHRELVRVRLVPLRHPRGGELLHLLDGEPDERVALGSLAPPDELALGLPSLDLRSRAAEPSTDLASA